MNQENQTREALQTAPEKQKKNNRILLILLGALTLLLLAGGIVLFCLTRPASIDAITFAATELVLKEGQSALPAYTITPAEAGAEELQWKTTNRSVATVSNGLITAHSEGSCMISVTSESGAKDTLTVKVEAPILEPEAPVIGDWRLFAVAEGDQIRYFYSIEATLFLRENRSASLHYEDRSYEIEDWRYDRQEKNYTIFRWDEEALPNGFYYCRDGTSPYDRCLIIPLPEGETLIFHRENES